jgi:hypothetical protein
VGVDVHDGHARLDQTPLAALHRRWRILGGFISDSLFGDDPRLNPRLGTLNRAPPVFIVSTVQAANAARTHARRRRSRSDAIRSPRVE